ncbi:TetR/AcrR family transcriptional regulator [Asticcacaulis solisilvae]|uniref:TetR/AcrR family transcriptional regulator n=1 Tax=Asticcacaulis solisilvae TaxID=1217274 RepID=UPI003FD71A4E
MRKASPADTTAIQPETETPQARLMHAVAEQWASHGRGRISARQTAAAAGVTTSLINYHFGSFERLLEASFRDFIEKSAAWWQPRLAALDGIQLLDPQAGGHLLASLIDEACEQARPMVFAWFECQAMAARDPAFAGAAAEWYAVWRDAWAKVATVVLPGDAAGLLYPFADGELCLHRLGGQPPLDRACLFETCVAWVGMVTEGKTGPMPLRETLRARCENPAPLPWEDDSVEGKIALAAADIVGKSGTGGITHRAVAAATELSLGVVSYHFPTAEELVHSAFAAIYGQIIRADQRQAQPAPAGAYAAGVAQLVAHPDAQANFLSLDEFISAAARDPMLGRFGGTLRYTRGRTVSRTLTGLPSPLAGALISSWTNGLIRQARFVAETDRETWARALCLNLLTRSMRT